MTDIPSVVFAGFGLDEGRSSVSLLSGGLIHTTWKVKTGDTDYVLQRMNSEVFPRPMDVAENIRSIARFLRNHFSEYSFPAPVPSVSGKDIAFVPPDNYFRLFPFVNGSHTVDVVTSPSEAYEAALQFGRFTAMLEGFDIHSLLETIPGFHNLSTRYRLFKESLSRARGERKAEARRAIEMAEAHARIVGDFESMVARARMKKRVTHHDTKISNVLLDSNGHGICVIDLDTVMPGYYISDLGDMMRTCLSPAGEEEQDTGRVAVRFEYFEAIVNGYLDSMQGILLPEELRYICYSGCFIIYMQALRFLTDHLNNDIYYGAKYDGHNLARASNQFALLERYLERYDDFSAFVKRRTGAESV